MNSAIKIILALGVVSLASCADRFDQSFPVESTAYDSAYAYLDSYAPLKEYLAQSKNPNVHLGVGTSASDYIKKGVVYALTNSNFTETEPGNAMKMASCVNADGDMDFETVENYVNAATDAGLSVYGHTLAWHAQQPVAYLNKCIADKMTSDGPAVVGWTDVKKTTYKDGKFPYYPMGCEPPVIDGSIHFVGTGNWSQFFCSTGNSLEEGNYRAVIHVKSSAQVNANFVVQNGWGGDAQKIQGNITLNEGWSDIVFEMSGVKGGNYDMIIQPGTAKATIDLQSITIQKKVLLNVQPQTPEEKKDTLTKAMDRWIKGMMEACQGKVKAWDVVNEAISGQDKDGDGYYDLQSATRGTVSKDDAKNNFYWQDYLGDLDYVRTAVRLARQYGPKDVKLFINDYNLESDWDGNKKLKSLIHWIQLWEGDGVTKIDGIGSQMHIACYMNKQVEESKKNAIVNMFKLLAQSGKLVRISELDMCLVDKDGKNVNTADVTEEQHHAMADLYKFVVSKYFEIIPVAQQWGICQWCATDSPANSGWLANSPTGLWDLNYNRKHTYAGFADGLQGK